MPDHAAHLQAVLDAAIAAAKAAPTSANIGAMEKARRAVDDYALSLASDAAGEKFKTQAAALDYLQRRFRIEKSKLSKDVQDGKVLRKNGVFTAAALDNYAITHRLPANDNQPIQTLDADIQRFRKAIADEKELKVKQMKDTLLDAGEEEIRDAAILLGIRRHLEVAVPDRVKMIISTISGILNDEQRGTLSTRMPEIIESDLEAIADIFDNLAQRGGVEL